MLEYLHITHMFIQKVFHMWVVPSCGDDAINRTMVRVVTTVVRVSEDACRACR
jgi:hypothetical protein